MRIVICDDEAAVRDTLAEKAKEYCPRAEVLCCQSGEELLGMEPEPDILFLDIQMHGGCKKAAGKGQPRHHYFCHCHGRICLPVF